MGMRDHDENNQTSVSAMRRSKGGEAMLRLAKFLAVTVLLLPAASLRAAPAPVEVPGGAVQGVVEGDVLHYWGIPFAAAAVGAGARRSRRSHGAAPWSPTSSAITACRIRGRPARHGRTASRRRPKTA